MEENLREIKIDENTTVLTDDPDMDVTDLMPANEESNGTSLAVVAGFTAAVAGAGYLLYRGGKWAIGKIQNKSEENAVKKLRKKGYYIEIPLRDEPEEQRPVAEEDDFEEEPLQEEKETKKKK